MTGEAEIPQGGQNHENVSAIGSDRRDYSRIASKFTGENYSSRLRLTGSPD